MKTRPLVSIVLCSYNGERHIKTQIESLINQTWSNIEIIVLDDCSTDKTDSIIKSYIHSDQRISYYKNETNLGVNKNFEKACRLANGEFIAISDQDDYWRSDKIEVLMGLFNEPDIVLAYGQSVRFTESIPLHVFNYNKRNLFEGNQSEKLLFFNTIAGHNIIFRKTLLNHAIPFNENVFYDWWIAMIASCQGKIANTDKVLTFHRHHDSNVTLGKKDEKRQTYLKALERIRAAKSFAEIKNLNIRCKKLATQLHANLIVLEKQTFSFRLFLFLFKNAKTFFFFKKAHFPFFSYLKISYRLSWAKKQS